MELSESTTQEIERISRYELLGREQLEQIENELLRREGQVAHKALLDVRRRLGPWREAGVEGSEGRAGRERARPPRLAVIYFLFPTAWTIAFNILRRAGTSYQSIPVIIVALLSPFALLSTIFFFMAMHEWAQTRVENDNSTDLLPKMVLVATRGIAIALVVLVVAYSILYPNAGMCRLDDSYCT